MIINIFMIMMTFYNLHIIIQALETSRAFNQFKNVWSSSSNIAGHLYQAKRRCWHATLWTWNSMVKFRLVYICSGIISGIRVKLGIWKPGPDCCGIIENIYYILFQHMWFILEAFCLPLENFINTKNNFQYHNCRKFDLVIIWFIWPTIILF